MGIPSNHLRNCALLLCGLFFMTLCGEEPKTKDSPDLTDDGKFGTMQGGHIERGSLPTNSELPGFMLNGDNVITLTDPDTKKKVGIEVLQFYMNYGMKINRLAEISSDFDVKQFKVKKTGDGTYTLTSRFNDKKIGSLVLKVHVSAATPDFSGEMIFYNSRGKEIKFFTGRHIFITMSDMAKDQAKLDDISVPELPKLDEKDIDPKSMAAFQDAYVDAIEKQYAAQAPPDLLAWLKTHTSIRKDFWLALSSQYDDAKAACAIMDALRTHNAKAVEKFPHLAIAIAVVYDSPKAITDSRMKYIWGVNPSQYSPVCSYIETFDYFSDKSNQSRFTFKPDQLPWPILVHLVDFDISKEDIAWAWRNCRGSQRSIGDLYQTVPYDNDKLARKTPKLGTNPYTLENLRNLGGVCVEQAHFTSRVAKAFGVPAMKVGGESRHGTGHAWAGFLVNIRGRPQLEFTGRYFNDYYYTGDIYDPQTNTTILDRQVAMLYDGISLSFNKYQESMTLARAARKLIITEPEKAMQLAEHAINRDTFNPDAWEVLAKGVSYGFIEPKKGNSLAARLMKDLVNHPDLTLACLKEFMAAIPITDTSARQKTFNTAYGLYAKRPDLQIQLRLMQSAELAAAKKETEAMQLCLQTCSANAKEGGLILPLVDYVVSLTKENLAKNPRFPVDTVRKSLGKIAQDFPRQRGDTVSNAYFSLMALIQKLE